MASSKSDIQRLKKRLDEIVKSTLSQTILKQAAEAIIERIQKRIRLGYGVSREGAPREPLAKLSKSYKDYRSGKIAFYKKDGKTIPYKPKAPPALDPTTSAGKSNLTKTGQMIRSIEITSMQPNEILIGFSSGRDDGFTNDEIRSFVSIKRPFFHLTDTEIKAVVQFISKKLRESIASGGS